MQVAKTVREIYLPAYVAEVRRAGAHAITSERSFLERLVHFWSNHFAVSVDKIAVLGLAGAMEREAIRPHVLGNFADMLLAVEQHPAMLLYLDNQLSIGPDSQAARIAGAPRPRTGTEREPGARDPGAAHAGRGWRLYAAGCAGAGGLITGWSVGGDAGRLRGGEPGEILLPRGVPSARIEAAARQDAMQTGGWSRARAALRDLALHPAHGAAPRDQAGASFRGG